MAKGVTRTIGIYINGAEIKNDMNSIVAEFKKAKLALNQMTLGSEEYYAQMRKIKNLRSVINEHNDALGRLEKRHRTLGETFAYMGMGMSGWLQTIQQVGFYGQAIKQIALDMAKMDDLYADIRKYTSLTKEEVKELNEEFLKFNTRTSREQLNLLAAEAGKLGIKGVENLRDFVQAANIIQVALGEDLGEDAFRKMGKLTQMFNIDGDFGLKDGMLKVASAINEVSQNSSAAAPYLLEFTNRLSGVAQQAGMTIPQIIGFASVLDQNAQHVEMSATAMNRFIVNLAQKTDKVAAAAGINARYLKKVVENDINKAMLMVFQSLNEKGNLVDLAPLFKDLGAEGSRAAQVIAVLAQKVSDINKEQALANAHFNMGVSVLNETNIKENTLQAMLEKSRKKYIETRLELGEKLYPVIIKIVNAQTAAVKGISWLSENYKSLAAIMLPLTVLFGKYIALKIAALGTRIKLNVQQQITAIQEANELSMAAKKLVAENAIIAAEKRRVAGLLAKQAAMHEEARARELGIRASFLMKEAEAAEAAATNATTTAINAKRAAMAKVPWAAIAMAVMAVVAAIVKLWQNAHKAEKAMAEFYAETEKAKAGAHQLIEEIKKATAGSEQYERVLNRLKELYPDIVEQMINEKGELKDLDALYKQITKSIEANTAAKLKGKYIEENTDFRYERMGEAIKAITDNLKKRGYDDTTIQDYIKYIKEQVAPTDIEYRLAAVWKTSEYFNKPPMQIRDVAVWAETLIHNIREINNVTRDASVMFDTFGENAPKAMSETAKQIKEVERKLYDLQEKRKEATDDEEIKRYDKVIDKEQKRLKILAQINATESSIAALQEMQALQPSLKIHEEQIKKEQDLLKKLQDALAELDKMNVPEGGGLTKEEGKAAAAAERARKKAEKIQSQYEQWLQDVEFLREESAAKIRTEMDKELLQSQKKYEKLIDQGRRFAKEDIKNRGNYWKTIKELNKEQQNELMWISNKHLTELRRNMGEIADRLTEKKDETARALMTKFQKDVERSVREWNKLSEKLIKLQRQASLESLNPNLPFGQKLERFNFMSEITQLQTEIAELQKNDIFDIISQYEKELTAETLSESEKRIAQIKLEWAEKIRIAEQSLDMLRKLGKKETDEEVVQAVALIAALKAKRDELLKEAAAGKGVNFSLSALFGISDDAWKDWENNWQNNLTAMVNKIHSFAQQISEIQEYMHQAEINRIEAEYNAFKTASEEKQNNLDRMLSSGLISQERYDMQKGKLDAEAQRKEKELALEKWKIDKKTALQKAIIDGIAAAITSFASLPVPWGLIPMAISVATTGALIAQIESTPPPYAKGGYIRKEKIIKAGEAGPEWVASNTLLKDKQTGYIIEQLERKQRGLSNIFDHNILTPNQNTLSQAANTISHTFVPAKTEIINNNYTTTDTEQMQNILTELKALNRHMTDPKNRQAQINRNIMIDFEVEENFLRNIANLTK
jgi:TP901 family phage tail tape measure protein